MSQYSVSQIEKEFSRLEKEFLLIEKVFKKEGEYVNYADISQISNKLKILETEIALLFREKINAERESQNLLKNHERTLSPVFIQVTETDILKNLENLYNSAFKTANRNLQKIEKDIVNLRNQINILQKSIGN